MADLKTSSPSGAFYTQGTTSPSVDNIRRTFGIGDKVAELAPETSIFFSYLSKLGKKATDETVWRPLEYRNQWQRRNFYAEIYKKVGAATLGTNDFTGALGTATGSAAGDVVVIYTDYDKNGKKINLGGIKADGKIAANTGTAADHKGFAPIFLLKNQMVRINGLAYKIVGDVNYYKWASSTSMTVSTKAAAGTEAGFVALNLADLKLVEDSAVSSLADPAAAWDQEGQVMGSQWGEGTAAPDGFRDELSSVEFYTQIFKTAVPLMSGSMMATKYRGYANEWQRIYAEHLKAHKMDLENAFLFGRGAYHSADQRFSWGAEPFIRAKGKKYEVAYSGSAGSTAGYDANVGFSYDGIVDLMDDFMSYESGNSGQKLCLTSRKVINKLMKTGSGNFLDNSFSSDTKELFNASLDVKKSSFMPIDITSVSTSWGSMNFVAHPLMRNDMEDKAVCIDLSNVSYRPLAGNGVSRDTFVETNVQNNDIDGRKDMIITEAGLEVMLPETHAVIDFV